MRLKITHRTEYRYDEPVNYALWRLRLVPCSGGTQIVRFWSLAVEGAREEARYIDQFGNDVRLISITGDPKLVSLEASGEVETADRAGVTGSHRGFAPLWLFQQETPATAPGDGIRALAAEVGEGDQIAAMHRLMLAIRDRAVAPAPAVPAGGGAEEAWARGSSASPDQAEIFVAAARLLGLPARYVSGYLMAGGLADRMTTRSWAEAHVAGLGWVGFDAANDMSPDETYVRIATGRDHRDAAAVSGIRLGQTEERLAASITVEQ